MTEYELIVAAREERERDARVAADLAWKRRALAYCPASPDGRHMGTLLAAGHFKFCIFKCRALLAW